MCMTQTRNAQMKDFSRSYILQLVFKLCKYIEKIFYLSLHNLQVNICSKENTIYYACSQSAKPEFAMNVFCCCGHRSSSHRRTLLCAWACLYRQRPWYSNRPGSLCGTEYLVTQTQTKTQTAIH